jgi:hypothetical protein
MVRIPSYIILFIAVLILAACSQPTKTETVQASNTVSQATAPAAPVSGKTAYWAMYKAAYNWANDSVPLKIESKKLSTVKNQAGSAAMWSATFGSARRREAVEVLYAVEAQPPDIVKGVNFGHAVPWGGPSREVMPFTGSDIVVDSDAAYKTAADQAQSWLKAHKDMEASLLLGHNGASFATPVWYVSWGDKNDGYRVFVNTKTGEVAKRAK